MSRTWKDRPLHVRLRENLQKGLIDHDHIERGERSRTARYPDRQLSVAFYKRDAGAIEEYRAYLDSLGDQLTYELEEKAGSYSYDWAEVARGNPSPGTWTPKTVEFKVYRVYTYPAREIICLAEEPERYDPHTQADRVTGLLPSCSPEFPDDMWRRSRGKIRNQPERAAVRAHLKTARDLANSGELDEDYSDTVYEEPFGPKIWRWDD